MAGRLTFRKGHGYTRDLGWKLNADGQRIQPRFLLGHDQRAAELAAVRLESLWGLIVTKTEQLNEGRQRAAFLPPGTFKPEQPVWDEFTLRVADAIRKGQSTVTLPAPRPDEIEGPLDDASYAWSLHWHQREFAGIIAIVPEDSEAVVRGQDQHRSWADHQARKARTSAAVAGTSIPNTGTDQTLHQAIEAYAAFVEVNGAGGKNEPVDARAMMRALPDAPLSQVGFDALHRLGDYWRGRPATQRPGGKGRPIAITTVDNRLKTARRLFRWLHRSDAWSWRLPDEWQEALRFNVRQLMTEDELLSTANGPETWRDDELVTLYRYATDRERCLLLMGLNLGFGQSECISFRPEDIRSQAEPIHISRVRRKTGRLFKAQLWPETVQALAWLAQERPAGGVPHDSGLAQSWVLLLESGVRPTSNDIANRWNKLVERVRRDHPAFRRLSFKYLRKTAYQLVLEASGSHEVAGTFEGRGSLASDEHADAYGRRLFDRVFEANRQIHDRLSPMFAAAPEAFRTRRPRGCANISLGTIDRIAQLAAQGIKPRQIAAEAKVSLTTVYRRLKKNGGLFQSTPA